MAKMWCYVLYLMLSSVFFVPTSLAKDVSSSTAKNKKTAHKTVAAKQKTLKKSSLKKRRTAAIQRSKTVRSRSLKKPAVKRVAVRASRTAKRKAKPIRAAALASQPLGLVSNVAFVIDQSSNEVLYSKNSNSSLPIASLTKLMTALVVLDSRQDMNETLKVTSADIDTIKYTSSRLPIGSQMSRSNMLHISLMSSENRAASALGRNYPGGLSAFVKAMNRKAAQLGMSETHFVEPTGLSSENVSSARDLAKLATAAHKHRLIRKYSTQRTYKVNTGGPVLQYRNSNRLISNPGWDIVLQKTGYISEAGRCLVMQAVIQGRSIVMVFLGSRDNQSRAADASSIRNWLENHKLPAMAHTETAVQG